MSDNLKILYAVDKPLESNNEYVKILITKIQTLEQNKTVIDWGIKKFWSDDAFKFNIIHIMWPHFLLLKGSKQR